ncbi:organelle RRM domain-containing protein 6, chloroplastic [Dioscorea cayenensis subsp. rotundata]|uniref:Organelle RRM domain-containing protein 6, chloroplastic n=1 Tax=Dioscorea cayennensis subsp. rotundata TaxID=55577 RepID=A0AB40CH05_DIOCR|nr:organelle RRM domain-containing protein 6, chloroplastic [Dioscorea cayenensis subsp. rotundata]
MAASSAMAASLVSSSIPSKTSFSVVSSPFSFLPVSPSRFSFLSLHSRRRSIGVTTVACLPSTPKISITPRTRLFVSGLSFRTTEDSLRNAFQPYGQLVEVNLVMDRIANRPRGFAFLRYATEEESKKAIDGMHGKFLDGRVIFVEVARPRSELHPDSKRNPKQH